MDSCCRICGFPPDVCSVVRFGFSDPTLPPGFGMKLIIPTVLSDTDVLICTECIRSIKRCPFSEIDKAEMPL